MAYSDDDDLQKIRSTIMSLGVDDWSDFHDLAATAIDYDIEVKWYRKASSVAGYDWRFTPFDATLMLNSATQLLNLSCCKTFFLIYRYLAQDVPWDSDVYGQQRDYWLMQYEAEFLRLTEAGIDYDWDNAGSIDTWEKAIATPSARRLMRV